ncbi:hypothetical protein [Bdellovibrio sp. HCB209]|uniref:hypothetical protein n=1 Tax=Bdellovibrio sp. HCB209 TaxID=3394354 RepID=UPI0039B4692B
MNIKLLKNEFLLSLDDDDVGLWEVWVLANQLYQGGPEVKKAAILEVIRELLDEKSMIAGEIHDGVIKKWKGTSEEIIERIDSEWRKLNRDPDLGDVVWFFKV